MESTVPLARLSRSVDALVILVAAGRSKRLPGNLPKQLLHLEGLPVITWAARAFESASRVAGILPVHPPELELEVAEALAMGDLKKLLPGVPGGDTRQQSVANGLRALPPGPEVILVHDAARPLVSLDLIERVIEAAALHGAAVPILPITETVKEVVGKQIVQTLDRSSLYVAQTPQGFRREMLQEAIQSAVESGYFATDEASLVERMGQMVHTVPGERSNLKITIPEDLAVADTYLKGL